MPAHRITAEQIAAVERLLELSNPDPAVAQEQIAELHAFLEEEDEPIDSGSDLMWLFKDITDWRTGFFVDWKDTESFIDCLDTLCETRGVKIDWGVTDTADEEFLENTSVPDMMQHAYSELAASGLTLWNWATESDCYSGWISRSADDAEVYAVSEQLQVDFRTGDAPF